MTSIRVPSSLLVELRAAAPPGTSLAAVIARLLRDAGGPERVRTAIRREGLAARARARTERLRAAGHRSVVLGPSEQLSLAEGCRQQARVFEARGMRRFNAETRHLEIVVGAGRKRTHRLRAERAGGLMDA